MTSVKRSINRSWNLEIYMYIGGAPAKQDSLNQGSFSYFYCHCPPCDNTFVRVNCLIIAIMFGLCPQTWETPLHFACKYGHADIVEYLVSHPLTDVQRPNKYGETPAEVGILHQC